VVNITSTCEPVYPGVPVSTTFALSADKSQVTLMVGDGTGCGYPFGPFIMNQCQSFSHSIAIQFICVA
jgi:hypothetical protein